MATNAFTTQAESQGGGDQSSQQLEGQSSSQVLNGLFSLRNKFRLSFLSPSDNITNVNYEKSLIDIGVISHVEDFWNIYCHIHRPQDLQSGTFYLFLASVRPMWEDPANVGGGRFNIKIKKGYVNKIWEDLIIAFLGETCEDKDLLNGLVLQIKKDNDFIQLWVREIPKHRASAKTRIQMWIAESIGLDPAAGPQTFQFQSHQGGNNKSAHRR